MALRTSWHPSLLAFLSATLCKLKILGALYSKLTRENTSASYYKYCSKELIYYMVKKTTS